MDLVAGTKRVIVAMEHTTKDGAPRIVRQCTLPLTGVGVVQTIITELAVIRVADQRLYIDELMPGSTLEQVIASTGAELHVSVHLQQGGVGPQ